MSSSENGTNLKALRKRLGITQGDFAASLGVKQSIMSAYETGAVQVPNDIAQRLYDLYKVNLNWLFGHDEKMILGEHPDDDGVVWIELVSDLVEIDSRGGFTVVGAAPLLRDFAETPQKFKMYALTVKGDNMDPTISSGDCVYFSPGAIDGDGIYILSINRHLVCRRLEFLMDGSVRVISDNPRYSTQTVPRECGPTCEIIGRVVCRLNKMR